MDRRDFMVSSGILTAAAFVAQGAQAAAAKGETERQVLPINRGWRYSRKVVAGGHDVNFDDSAFEKIAVPHTNTPLPWHGFSEKEYQFVSLYRRKFRLPASAKGKHVFVDFEGVMTAATVWINGHNLGEYKGGYTPFSFDLTPYINFDGENVLAVDVDSSERADIPPFGNQVDYLTFGGIYREVALRIVGNAYIDNIFARPLNVLSGKPGLEVDCHLKSFAATGPLRVEAVLKDGKKTIAKASAAVDKADGKHTIRFAPISGVKLWDLEHTNLYTVEVTLSENGKAVDADCRRFGFRTVEFTDHGFTLNGKVVKLRGLDRHQTFPFMGQAMAARGQRRDAWILRKELKCNIVRTSHYPQSRHFLDACDELGLLVLEEIPGWQHIGDLPWQDLSVDNVNRMITRDWNHPAIILWGVRINESPDNHDFYTRTNALAHSLDPTRQTGGIRNKYDSELLEDVFTMNDFGFPLRAPNHPRYLNTEYAGHTYPTRTTDNNLVLQEHVVRHARVQDQIASDPKYAGGIGWCAFDYNTHAEFGAGDRICYHGVTDIFREPKPAAYFYRSQCEPSEEIVLELGLHWALGDVPDHLTSMLVCSNCDSIRLSLLENGKWADLGEATPDRTRFSHLKYPPFTVDLKKLGWRIGDLKIEGFIKGKLVKTRMYSGLGADQKFEIRADDTELFADGMDATRVVLRVTDEFGNIRPFSTDAIVMALEGPAELIGDNPFGLVAGTGAVWVRAKETAGVVRLTAKHPRLGIQTISIAVRPGQADGA